MACTVSASAQELVGLPSYSNITIGPITITRDVEDDTPEGRKAALKEIHEEIREDLAAERSFMLKAVEAFAKSGGYGDVRQAR